MAQPTGYAARGTWYENWLVARSISFDLAPVPIVTNACGTLDEDEAGLEPEPEAEGSDVASSVGRMDADVRGSEVGESAGGEASLEVEASAPALKTKPAEVGPADAPPAIVAGLKVNPAELTPPNPPREGSGRPTPFGGRYGGKEAELE